MNYKILFILTVLFIFVKSSAFEINIEGLDSLGLEENEEIQVEKNTLSLKENKIEFSGDFSFNLSYIKNDTDTMNYVLKDHKNLILETGYKNELVLNLNSSYKFESFDFVLKTYSNYIDEENNSFNFYEGYLSYSPNYNLYIQGGKASNYWGKGYAYNPVGVINPLKDPDSPEDSGEGKNQLNLEYTKAFSDKKIQAFTGNFVLLFDEEESISGVSSTDNLGIAAKTYFLIGNSDIDLIYYNKNNENKFGFDFSTNIFPELEFHGEYLRNLKGDQIQIDDNGNITNSETNFSSYLVGIKLVLPTTTNLTIEYFYDESGISWEEYKDLFENYSSDNDTYLNLYKSLDKNPMEQYLYLKISHQEPFDILYTNFSISAVVNIEDESFSVKSDGYYEPYNNINTLLEVAMKNGESGSEYGDKESVNTKIGVTIFF